MTGEDGTDCFWNVVFMRDEGSLRDEGFDPHVPELIRSGLGREETLPIRSGISNLLWITIGHQKL